MNRKSIGLKYTSSIFGIIILMWISVYYKSCNTKLKCEELNKIFETDSKEYKVVIFDFLDFTNCNSYQQCEEELENIILGINEYSHLPINSHIIPCSSKKYNIDTPRSAESICNENDIDLIIYGGIESQKEGLNVKIRYATNTSVLTTNTKTSGTLKIRTNSILDLEEEKGNFQLIEDLIHWNLASRFNRLKNEEENNIIQGYLGKISKLDTTLYYFGNLIGARQQIRFKNFNKARKSINKCIEYDYYLPFAHYEKSLLELQLGKIENSANEMKVFEILKDKCKDGSRTISVQTYDRNMDIILPKSIGQDFECLDTINFKKHSELGYISLLQNLPNIPNMEDKIDEVYCYWKKIFPNSKLNPFHFKTGMEINCE